MGYASEVRTPLQRARPQTVTVLVPMVGPPQLVGALRIRRVCEVQWLRSHHGAPARVLLLPLARTLRVRVQ